MKKTSILLLFLLFLFINSQAVFAVTDNQEQKQSEKSQKSELKQQIKQDKTQYREELKAMKEDFREEMKASKSALKSEYKAKLATIKNEAKRQVVESFTVKMNQVNQNRVSHWEKVLNKLSDLLERIETITGNLRTGGKDTSLVDEKIDIAKEKLDIAQTNVEAQKVKDYSVNISSESALKANAGAAMKAEQSDLRAVQVSVNDAKKAIHEALMTLKREFGGSTKPVSTPSGTPTTIPSVSPTSSPSATPVI